MTGNLALIVDESGAALEPGTHHTLVLVHADGRRERVGLKALGAVVLYGDVQLSTKTLANLATEGIALSLLPASGRSGRPPFSLLPNHHALLRHSQHLAYSSCSARLALARRVILAKFDSIAETLRHSRSGDDNQSYLAMRAASAADSIDQLMGIEGALAAKYYRYLGERYAQSGQFSFGGRSKRPPLDPPNALMSLGYTLALSQATQLVLHAGLDPQIGFLHGPLRNRASLALDLIEPARAVIDRWVFTLLAGRTPLTADMFSSAAEGGRVTLSKPGRALFYPAWFRDGCRLALPPMAQLLAALSAELKSTAE